MLLEFMRLLASMLILLIFSIFALAQTKVESSGEFLGEFREGKYQNGFFGFTLSVPPEMYFFSDQERAIYRKAGEEMFVKDLEKGRAAFEKAASQEILIFSVAMDRPGVKGVSSLNIGAVKQPDGTTPDEICDDAAAFFVKNPNYTLTSKTRKLKRAGRDFGLVEFTFSSGEQRLALRYYATMRRGYSITFVLTYLSKADLDSLEKVLDSLAFF